MKYLLFVAIAMVVVSCKVSIPKGVLSVDHMTDLLYDYHLAQQMADCFGDSVAAQRYILIHKVFEKYNVSEQEFDKSMIWYSSHTKYLTEIYEKLEIRISREMKALGMDAVIDEYANLSDMGDTARVWSRTNLWLRNAIGENLLSYNIQPDSTFRLGDTFLLRFSNTFVSTTDRFEGYAILSAHFDNDSVSAQTIRIGGNEEINLRIYENELTKKHQLSRLTLTFYLNYSISDPLALWLIKNPILIRFHKVIDQEQTLHPQTDSIAKVDKDTMMSRMPLDTNVERLSPSERRLEHKGAKNIHVIKQRKVILPLQQVNHR